MGQVREVEITEADIAAAVNETEKEIAGAAWGEEDTEALDATGDRSLESMGEGLEGQHEADEEEAEGEESEGEAESEEGEGEQGEQPLAAAEKAAGEPKPQVEGDEPKGRVPAGRLREATERARAAEAERDAERTARAEESKKLASLEAQMATLTQLLSRQQQPQQVAPPPNPEPKAAPDIFENPQGFVEHITNQLRSELGGVRQDLQRQSVETSFRIAHVRHGEAFPKAMEAVNQLNANNPDDRATVQRIYNAPDPGEALVQWHRRNETLARVGNDPAAYEERIRKETQEALMKDPEFRKQLLASLRSEAQQGDDGRPRTTTRLPTSVARASGSNVGASRENYGAMDDSDQAVAEAAWR